jgi:DNA-binding GntR family transcriptional regulator
MLDSYAGGMAAANVQALGAIPLQTRRELILARLRQAISSGELPPGTHLAEVELSETLGVSRGTLREALRHLQQEGLLTVDARGRLSVRVVTVREVREIFSVRCAIESLAFGEICASPDRSNIAVELDHKLEDLRAAEGDFGAQLEADLAFHERMCELCANTTLLHTWHMVSGLSRAAVTAAGPETALHNMAYERHRPIVKLIEAGDVPGGQAYLEDHMREAAERVVARMEATQAGSVHGA